MDTDVLLSTLLKLVSGDKERCFQLVKQVRSRYPNQTMQWCIQKAIYDLRYRKVVKLPPPPPPNQNPGKALRQDLAQSRQDFIGKPEDWHWSQVTQKSENTVKPNPKLARWGSEPASPAPAAKSPSSPTPGGGSWGAKGVKLNAPEPEKPLAVSSQSLQALVEAKRKMVSPQSSEASRKKLFRLTGNVETGRRLVQRIRVANPDRSEQWAVDKAIYDLERDRL